MKMIPPFVKLCPDCRAPTAEWELDEYGALIAHLKRLHWLRLTDLSLGKTPRWFISDRWDAANHRWVRTKRELEDGELQTGQDEEKR